MYNFSLKSDFQLQIINSTIMKNCIAKLCCICVGIGSSIFTYSQELPQVGQPVLSRLNVSCVAESAKGDISYAYPQGLRNLGTINQDEESVVCNYLSFNRIINKDYHIWAPLNDTVLYKNTSSATSPVYRWTVPGGKIGELATRDAEAVYTAQGVYDFPTLAMEGGSGGGSFTAEGRILVSGKAEISTADTRQWGETYQTAYYPLSGNAGYLGGTNSANLNGYGNLFMTSQKNAFMLGVNVYLPFLPTRYEDDSQLLLQVWYPMEIEGQMVLNALPLEAVFLPMKDIRPAKDGEVPIKNVAVAEFMFQSPLQIWDKPLFFVTVEGFGDDPAVEDFCILTEIMGKEMDEADMSNLFSHNSFVRYGDSEAYQMPINYFGAMPGASFMICPIIDNFDADTGSVESASYSETVVVVHEGWLSVVNPVASELRIYSVDGCMVGCESFSGKADIQLPSRKGVYIVQLLQGGCPVDVRKVVNR